jgi:cbb3-type cytochrome oxidase cytochrome c subunit
VAVAQNAPPETAFKFTEKYEELRSRNIRDLDALVQFLNELDKNKDVASIFL